MQEKLNKKILIFGGSGFIGSGLVDQISNNSKYKIDIVCTNREKSEKKLKNKNIGFRIFNIFDETILKDQIKEYDVIINLIGKLFEKSKNDFDKFHHQFPALLSKNISEHQLFIHISALGVEQSSKSSLYAKSKIEGEQKIIRNLENNYVIIKPSIVFGEEDNFFNLFAQMSRFSPILPLIGGGEAKFAPIYVKDINKSILEIINRPKQYKGSIFEAYGKKEASFKELMQFILKSTKKKRLLLNIPFSIAKFQAKIINFLRIYVLTSDQVELLKYNNVASKKFANIDTIIKNLANYEDIVPQYLNKNSND
ncbi:complex I NDUFA9 subunit family protein [Rickettsiales bacterium]|nr:complex I NDUFA9 subunit family protein [Rickettsiales bacterium]